MNLDTIVRLAHSRKDQRISAKFKTDIPFTDIGKKGSPPFYLTLIMAGNKRLTFKVPHTLGLGTGEGTENSRFRKSLVIKEKTENTVVLHWTPAGEHVERGFDVTLTFIKEKEGTFKLTIRLPDTFKMWGSQAKNPSGMVAPDYSI